MTVRRTCPCVNLFAGWYQTGSQPNTSPDRSSGMDAAFIASTQCAAIVSGVQPFPRWTIRIGRGELNRYSGMPG